MENAKKARETLTGAIYHVARPYAGRSPLYIAKLDLGDAEALLILGEALRALQTPRRKKR